MAGQDRRSARDLIAEIGEDAPRFGFFQAVRLLALASSHDDAPSVPAFLRFGTPLSLGFPPSEILGAKSLNDPGGSTPDVDDPHNTDPAHVPALHLTVGFMGMTGPSGVLPSTYTEALIERRNFHRDTSAHGFLDMFSHRVVSLFYQAWRKHRFHIAYEAGDRECFTRNVLDLVGAGLSAVQPRQQGGDRVPGMVLSHFAGLLSQRPVSAISITALLRGYFGVEVSVEQFVGQWMIVPESEQTRLGTGSCVLGESAFAGARLWDRQNKIRLRVGPLDREQFADFLPGRPGSAAVAELMQFCIGQTLACDVTLILRKDCVPPSILGQSMPNQLRLGHNTWLHQHMPPAHQEDAGFSLLS